MYKLAVLAVLVAVCSAQYILPLTYNIGHPLMSMMKTEDGKELKYTNIHPHMFHHPMTYHPLAYNPLWFPHKFISTVKDMEMPMEEKHE